MLGLGFKGYIRDPYNVYDCIIVVASIVDIVLTNLDTSMSTGVLTAVRAFRLLRLFKLAKQWRRLSQLLSTVVKTLKDVGTFTILMFLFIYVFALLGMNMFAFKVAFD